jgi:FKBP-type peptidyl-prolyl cis-trans isomerase
MKKAFIYAGVITTVVFAASCKKGIQKTSGGLEYMMYTENSGPKPKEGDIMRCDIIYKIVKKDGTDSVFFKSADRDTGAVVKLSKPTCKGCIEEGMMLMSAGDSATFIASADSFFLKTIGQDLPPFVAPGSKIKFEVKMHSIMSEAQRSEMLAKAESKTIADYIKQNNITTPPTADGLIVVETLAGTGVSPVAGDSVSVNYVGKFFNGKEFDSSLQRGPITFTIGQMQVIPGWEEAFQLMKEGGKATLVIPSALAYGERGYPPVIPASTPLVFDVELVKVHKVAAPATAVVK